MANIVQSPAAESNASGSPAESESWQELRGDPDIQFERITIPPREPREPGWFEEWLNDVFVGLADLFGPIGEALGLSWPVLKWGLLALVALFVLYLIYRLVGPMLGDLNAKPDAEDVPEWQPDQQESLALLEDADRLAAEGRFDEATHLLLQRSVGQIADARPDWVEPSSTARELAALPALSEAARGAFRVISERVERSLFALRSLNREDWEAARSAYAEFALAKIDQSRAKKANA